MATPSPARPIGVLMLETRFPRPPGDIGNSATFTDRGLPPPLYRRVPMANVAAATAADGVAGPIVEAMVDGAQALEADGAGAILTSCGFLASAQDPIAAAVSVPVLTSALVLLPLLRAIHGPAAKIGVLTFDARTLGRAHFGRYWDDRLAIVGVEAGRELHRVIAGDEENLDRTQAESDAVAAAQTLMTTAPETRVILLECTNLPPYADAIAAASGVPTLDLVGAATWLFARGGRDT